MTAKTMKSVMEELRQKSPELDQRLHASHQRQELALTLHGLRVKAGLTQKDVAALMGKDQAHVSRMESVTGPFPDASSIVAYAHACKSSAGYVFVTEGVDRLEVLAVPLGDEEESATLEAAMRAHNVDIAGTS